MSLEHAKRVRELFKAALSRAEPERRRFLHETCEDERTREDVEALLAADAQSGGFLEPPTRASRSATLEPPRPECIGQEIGPFEIVRLIGAGGMGTVYEARQREPRRRVALKLMRPGLADRDTLRRFKLEADILGRLRHPGIAQIYHAGQHAALGGALPYFAMEFVEGARTITDYANGHELDVRERIALFARVCDGVHHGHQRGVIHRDLKPGNILVDEAGQPKVIDFGVARPTDSATVFATLHTRGDLVVGTLQYMSPEQSSGPSADIDVRTDVYALGVVLFELLSGELPFDFTDVSPFDVPRVIRERAPRRLTGLRPALRGDVETIVHKALAKERERRYASVADLAADLRHYLRNEPIAARRDSGWYLLRKTFARHRIAAAVIAAFLVLSTGSAISLAVLYQRAERRAEALRHAGYFNSIALAHAAWEDANGARLWQYLRACPEDLRGWEWDYLSRLGDLSRRAWQAHESGASVACSADGDRLVSWAYDGSIKVWDRESGDLRLTIAAHKGPVSQVAFSPDGQRLASGGYDQFFRLWDAQTGALIREGRADEVRVTDVAYAPDGGEIATGGFDRAVRLWNGETGQAIATWPCEHVVQRVGYSPDGRRLVGCGESGISEWDTRTGQVLRSAATSDESEIRSMAISGDGSYLATGTTGQEVLLWRMDTLERVRVLSARETPLSLAFSPDSRRLAVSAGAAMVWDVETGRRETARLSESRIDKLAFAPDGSSLLAGELNGLVRVWDAAPITTPRVFTGHTDFVRGVVVYPDGRRIASVARDGTVRVWDCRSGNTQLTWRANGAKDQYIAIDPRGRWLVTCGVDSQVRVWDANTGKLDCALSGHRGPVAGVAVSPDGREIASVGADGSLRLWDAETGASTWTNQTGGPLSFVRFSPAADRLVTTGWDGCVRVWSLASHRQLHVLRGHDGLVIKADFSPHGRYIVSTGNDTTVRIWDAATGQHLRTLRGHHAPAQSLAFTHDGARLFTGGYDNLINLWDIQTGTLIMTLVGHRGGVTDLAMGPHDDWLVSCSNDRTVRVWTARDDRWSPGERREDRPRRLATARPPAQTDRP